MIPHAQDVNKRLCSQKKQGAILPPQRSNIQHTHAHRHASDWFCPCHGSPTPRRCTAVYLCVGSCVRALSECREVKPALVVASIQGGREGHKGDLTNETETHRDKKRRRVAVLIPKRMVQPSSTDDAPCGCEPFEFKAAFH